MAKPYSTSAEPFDAVGGGITPAGDPQKALEIVQPYADAGLTWWIEAAAPYDLGLGWGDAWPPELIERGYECIRQGPPRFA